MYILGQKGFAGFVAGASVFASTGATALSEKKVKRVWEVTRGSKRKRERERGRERERKT